MNQNVKYFLFLLIFCFNIGFAAPILTSYWQCTTHDNTNQEWSATNAYQKIALNIAFASCKKESKSPSTCRASVENCEGFNQLMSPKPHWRCTALDLVADAWQGTFYSHPDDAVLGAKANCRQKSVVPDTCYVNRVTCKVFIWENKI